jgi:hypothetical protein
VTGTLLHSLYSRILGIPPALGMKRVIVLKAKVLPLKSNPARAGDWPRSK